MHRVIIIQEIRIYHSHLVLNLSELIVTPGLVRMQRMVVIAS